MMTINVILIPSVCKHWKAEAIILDEIWNYAYQNYQLSKKKKICIHETKSSI